MTGTMTPLLPILAANVAATIVPYALGNAPIYDTLRGRAPVWRLPGQNSYLVSDPALVCEVVSRPTEFSSNLVSLLYRDASGCPAAFDIPSFDDPTHVLATNGPIWAPAS